MSWKPIVAGVDATADGAWSAAAAWEIAAAAQVPCYLVHAVPEVRPLVGIGVVGAEMEELRSAMLEVARDDVRQVLRGNAPEACLEALEVRFGRPVKVLAAVASEDDAGLVVLGGKRHTVLGRWLAGSTAHDAVRTLDLPVLVATVTASRIERVLAAVDLSDAARPTIQLAETFARLFGAHLRVMHAQEPIPILGEMPALLHPAELAARAEAVLEESVWPSVTCAGAERAIRHGRVHATIVAEVADWGADLVVVGSHGRGWVERALLGSVTEGLLRNLPASLLVVPVRAPAALVPSEASMAATGRTSPKARS